MGTISKGVGVLWLALMALLGLGAVVLQAPKKERRTGDYSRVEVEEGSAREAILKRAGWQQTDKAATVTLADVEEPGSAWRGEAAPLNQAREGPGAASASPTDDDGPDATDGAEALAKQEGVNLSTVKGTGQGGRITKADVERAAKT